MPPHPLRRHVYQNKTVTYRPISNLTFISSVLEKVVANRFWSHIYTTDLSNVLQSAYKQFHFSERALLGIHSLNTDNGNVTALTLLALSVAFGTVDHTILITFETLHWLMCWIIVFNGKRTIQQYMFLTYLV